MISRRHVFHLARRTHKTPAGPQPGIAWATTSTAAAATQSSEKALPRDASSKLLTARNLLLFGSGMAVGALITSELTSPPSTMKYPSGMPRTCACEEVVDTTKHISLKSLSEDQQALPAKLQKIVGEENVLDGTKDTTKTTPFLKGMRLGHGQALCIVTPRRLKHVYEILPHILKAKCVIMPQGQNTGLTGGSTPRQESTDDRPVVVLSMKHLDVIAPVDEGKRVLCLAGVGLASLDRFLLEFFPHRESHSNLGSTFLNPTTAAGIAFGSGGTQCLRKGPAFTERALYLKITQNKWKEDIIEIVNTLGIKKFRDSPSVVGQASVHNSGVYKLDAYTESIKRGFYQKLCVTDNESTDGKAPAHDVDYRNNICVHDGTVTRFNADTKGHDCNRSEGKVIILATVHDTFEKPKRKRSFWVGFETMDLALEFRRNVSLDNPEDLPLTVEYVDRDAFDVIEEAGRAMAWVIRFFGASSPWVQDMWRIKSYIESLPFASAPVMVDKCLYTVNNIFPSVLPKEVLKTGVSMDHHVAMTVGDFEDGGMDRLLGRLNAFQEKHGKDKVVIHECSQPSEVASLNAHRFVAAPCFRTWCVGNNAQGFSVDYALPKNAGTAPALGGADATPLKRMRYSHFGCNVVHEDLAFGPNVDLEEAKHALKATVEKDYGGKLPAEHGHGTEYHAPPATQKRWKSMDPTNVLNPGVGGLSTRRDYAKE